MAGSADEGGKTAESACVRQKGQSSKCGPCFAGEEEAGAWSISISINLRPLAVHISVHTVTGTSLAVNAWETAGASAAITMAQHAIHMVIILAERLIFICEILSWLHGCNQGMCMEHRMLKQISMRVWEASQPERVEVLHTQSHQGPLAIRLHAIACECAWASFNGYENRV